MKREKMEDLGRDEDNGGKKESLGRVVKWMTIKSKSNFRKDNRKD